MARVETNTHPNSLKVLRDVLRLISHNPTLEKVAPQVLETASQIAEAQAGFYLLYRNPRELFLHQVERGAMPEDEVLWALTENLHEGIHISSDLPGLLAAQFRSWLIVPVYEGDRAIGLFGLLFSGEPNVGEEQTDLLLSLIDSLRIVTRMVRTQVRHERIMRNQHEFVRQTTHDLRTPLTFISGFASMLEASATGELNDTQRRYVERILFGLNQMAGLVDNIQDAGRFDPENGLYEMSREPTDLGEMAMDIVKKQLIPAEKQNLTIDLHVADDLPIINVDTAMMERALINLVDNAVKYTPDDGHIEVGVRREDDYVLIYVRDNGYGISEENMRKLFQRHFRIRRREHHRVKGSGLGLFIVRSVAIHHSGDAWVESKEGEGSTFFIRLPLSGDNLLASAAAQDTVPKNH